MSNEQIDNLFEDLEEMRVRLKALEKHKDSDKDVQIKTLTQQSHSWRTAYEAEIEGNTHLRNLYGARADETLFAFMERVHTTYKKASALLLTAEPAAWVVDDKLDRAIAWEKLRTALYDKDIPNKQCPACDGEGSISYEGPEHGHAIVKTCTRCKGTGEYNE